VATHFWHRDKLLCSVQRELGQDLIGPVFKTLSDLAEEAKATRRSSRAWYVMSEHVFVCV
jgi:hypothetical protein